MTLPTIEIELAKILERIEQNLADFRKELADFRQEMNQRLTNLEIGQARLEERLTGEIKTVNAKLDGLSKRLDTQEFINRSVVVGLVLAIAAGVVIISYQLYQFSKFLREM